MEGLELLPCPFCGGEAFFEEDNETWKCVIGCHHKEGCAVGDWPKPLHDRKNVVVGDLDCCSDNRERAITAWNTRATLGSGKLTAEQVSKATYGHSIHADCADADWQAIADELNAALGNVTCELKGKSNTCTKCGASVQRVTHSVYEMGDSYACHPNFCPNCGAEVRKAVGA